MNKLFVSILMLVTTTGCGSEDEEKLTMDIPAGSMCVQPVNGLVGWWAGDGDANDLLGANNGQEINGATYASGVVNQAFSFDGTDDFIAIQDAIELNPVNAITVSAWISIKSTGDYQSIVSKFFGNFVQGVNDDTYGLMITPNGGLYWQLQTEVNGVVVGNILITNPVTILDEKFHLFVGTYDGNSMKVYLDGKIIEDFNRNPGTVSGSLVNSVSTPLYIGSASNRNANDWFVNGFVDEVILYNTALTDEQILNIYNAGTKGICKS